MINLKKEKLKYQKFLRKQTKKVQKEMIEDIKKPMIQKQNQRIKTVQKEMIEVKKGNQIMGTKIGRVAETFSK